MLAYSILLLILQNSLSLAGRFSPAVSMYVVSRCTLTAGPEQWAESSPPLQTAPACLQLNGGCILLMAAAVLLVLDCHRVLLEEESKLGMEG